MMRFVIEHDDVLLGPQLSANAADHLVGRFGKGAARPAGKDRLGDLGGGELLSQLERMVIRDEDLRTTQLFVMRRWHDVALPVVVVRVVGQQDP
jgi:hypothetical protein